MAIAAVVLGPILVALSYYLWGNNGHPLCKGSFWSVTDGWTLRFGQVKHLLIPLIFAQKLCRSSLFHSPWYVIILGALGIIGTAINVIPNAFKLIQLAVATGMTATVSGLWDENRVH